MKGRARSTRGLFLLASLIFIAACGGGGGTSPTGTTNTAGSSGSTSSTNTNTGIGSGILMGGAIQRNLTLAGEAYIFAGTVGFPGSADGIGSAAGFISPQGITTDGTNLYVTDANDDTIRKVVIATGAVTTIAGSAGVYGSTDGIGSAARFHGPCGITTDGTNLYVVDNQNSTIRKVVIATGAVTTIAGSAGVYGSTDGIGSAARFNYPQDITTDGTNLYIADVVNYTIRKMVIATGVVTTLAGSVGVAGYTDGIGSAARFYGPQGITTDGTNLYVTDFDTIRKMVIATGVVTTLAGRVGGGTSGTSAAGFISPKGITTDGTNLYVTDNFTIRKVQ